jgi:hypothetical protein
MAPHTRIDPVHHPHTPPHPQIATLDQASKMADIGLYGLAVMGQVRDACVHVIRVCALPEG